MLVNKQLATSAAATVTLTNFYPGAVAQVQDGPAVMIGVMATALAARMSGSLPPDLIVLVVLACANVAAFAAGAARLVDDDQRLLHQVVLGHHALDEARHLVGAAAGAGRHDEFDRLARLPCERRRGQLRDRTARDRQRLRRRLGIARRIASARTRAGREGLSRCSDASSR